MITIISTCPGFQPPALPYRRHRRRCRRQRRCRHRRNRRHHHQNYQITQQRAPLGTGGVVPLPPSGDASDRTSDHATATAAAATTFAGAAAEVPIERVHLEEDTAKMIHQGGSLTARGGRSADGGALVDLNRAGLALAEIVTEVRVGALGGVETWRGLLRHESESDRPGSSTEPALRSGAEAAAYGGALQRLLRHARVSDCRMEEGSLRLDVNVSLRRAAPPGAAAAALRQKVEVKNLNSLRSVREAVNHEVVRQAAIYEVRELGRVHGCDSGSFSWRRLWWR